MAQNRMEKIHIKESEQWGWWELASKSMGDEPASVFACGDCDESIVAKDAMHGGWVRLALVGETEPESEPATVGESQFFCPACQSKFGIDIEEGHTKRPVPEKDRSSRRGRGGGQRNRPRRGGSGNGAGSGSRPRNDRNKKSGSTEGAASGEGSGSGPPKATDQKNGGKRGRGSRNRNRRPKRPRSDSSKPPEPPKESGNSESGNSESGSAGQTNS